VREVIWLPYLTISSQSQISLGMRGAARLPREATGLGLVVNRDVAAARVDALGHKRIYIFLNHI
jgi:hypothetical protein